MLVFPQILSMSAQRRKALIERVLDVNKYTPEFRERLQYMNQFKMKTGRKIAPDEFGFIPKPSQNVALGYRINPRTLLAVTSVWLVDDDFELKGTTICDPVDGHGYFGIVLPKDVYEKYGGPRAYSQILGNLRLIQSLGIKTNYA